MIEIYLDKNTRITSDKLNYVIQERQKGGLVEWRGKYYYSSLYSMAKDLLEEKLYSSHAKSFEELIETVKDQKKECEKLIKKLKDVKI